MQHYASSFFAIRLRLSLFPLLAQAALAGFLLTLTWLPSDAFAVDNQNLPQLGSAGSAIITPARETRLGRLWQRSFQGTSRVDEDLLLSDYLQDLTKKLALAGGLTSLDLSVMTVTDDTLNAFAVPGGVVGIHTGLLRHAATIDQLSSVLAHELAHVNQRHFARRLEENQRNSGKYLAALLASIAIAAGGGAEAGIAAISATQAANIESQLRFSRGMESEADRLGLEIMRRAGYDPRGMAEMFENMLRASRYYRKPPAFLLSHPVTQNRVADARLRLKEGAAAYSDKPESDKIRERYYQWMRQRAWLLEEDAASLIDKHMADLGFGKPPRDGYKEALAALTADNNEQPTSQESASYYGLAISLQKNGQHTKSLQLTQALCRHFNNLACRLLIAENRALLGEQGWQQNYELLYALARKQPDQARSVAVSYAQRLMEKREYKRTVSLLEDHLDQAPDNKSAWYLLAETQGLVGNILGVHKARAEYFLLTGRLEAAALQLNYALEKAQQLPFEKAWVEEKLKELRQIERDIKEFS